MSIYGTWFMLDDMNEELGHPWVYEGSHVLPTENSPRGGWIEVGAIPDHIEREGESPPHDWLRLGVNNETIVLNRGQVEGLRETLTSWLDRPFDDEMDAGELADELATILKRINECDYGHCSKQSVVEIKVDVGKPGEDIGFLFTSVKLCDDHQSYREVILGVLKAARVADE
ncbi:MAG TPA: hypothetical protein VJ742_12895 [Nitrososphaera sp.]|nr:hypothetical protein [Nitrososphaera sp.]